MPNALKSESGFTFIEVMVAIVIISIACVGIMMGTVHVKGALRKIQVEEFANDQLLNYMEYWKGRVASKTLSPLEKAGDFNGVDVVLVGSNNNQESSVQAKVYYDIEYEPSNHLKPFFERYRITTWIEWTDNILAGNADGTIVRSKKLETVMVEFLL